MIIETERLRLRPFREADYPDITAYATDPEFYRYLPIEKQTDETLRVFFDERLADQEQKSKTRRTFAVALKADDRIFGTIRLGIFDEKERLADIGYAMDLARQGHGFMAEAVQRCYITAFWNLICCKYGQRSIKKIQDPGNLWRAWACGAQTDYRWDWIFPPDSSKILLTAFQKPILRSLKRVNTNFSS